MSVVELKPLSKRSVEPHKVPILTFLTGARLKTLDTLVVKNEIDGISGRFSYKVKTAALATAILNYTLDRLGEQPENWDELLEEIRKCVD